MEKSHLTKGVGFIILPKMMVFCTITDFTGFSSLIEFRVLKGTFTPSPRRLKKRFECGFRYLLLYFCYNKINKVNLCGVIYHSGKRLKFTFLVKCERIFYLFVTILVDLPINVETLAVVLTKCQ